VDVDASFGSLIERFKRGKNQQQTHAMIDQWAMFYVDGHCQLRRRRRSELQRGCALVAECADQLICSRLVEAPVSLGPQAAGKLRN